MCGFGSVLPHSLSHINVPPFPHCSTLSRMFDMGFEPQVRSLLGQVRGGGGGGERGRGTLPAGPGEGEEGRGRTEG